MENDEKSDGMREKCCDAGRVKYRSIFILFTRNCTGIYATRYSNLMYSRYLLMT